MLGTFLKWLGGGVVKQFTDPLLAAYQAKLNASNATEKLDAERAIIGIEAARDIAIAEAADRWSATRLGRWLIVVPFGIWWAAGCLIQVLNPWLFQPVFGTTAVVVALPPSILEMAQILVPAIVVGDAAALFSRKRA